MHLLERKDTRYIHIADVLLLLLLLLLLFATVATVVAVVDVVAVLSRELKDPKVPLEDQAIQD